MNLDELRSVRRTERQKDSLQHLRDSFYEDVADYVSRQKAERKRAADRADDPFSDPEVGRLTDEIETAEDVVEAIYERRVGKVVKLASFAAADMSADTNGLTAEERDLFEDLVDRIKRNRTTVLEVLSGERSGSTTTTDVGDAAGADLDVSDTESAARPTDEDGERETATAEAPDDTPPTPPDAPDASDGGSGDVLADAMGDGDDGRASAPDVRGESADVEADAAESESPPSTAPGADAEPSAPNPGRDEPESHPTDAADSAADRPETEATAVAEGESGVGESAEAGVGTPDDTGDAPNDTDGAPDDTDRVTLRITRDVGQILGVDEREYDLATEDVVTLPATNADPLVERGAAERLD